MKKNLSTSNATRKQLAQQLRLLSVTDPLPYLKVELKDNNMFEWFAYMKAPDDTAYAGGVFKLLFEFPEDYPFSPPKLKFLSQFWHPNVYKDGRVCISILHTPGDDPLNPQEQACERWLPIYTPETIMVCVMAMLSDPNTQSPANVDASVEFRKNRKTFENRVKKLVEKSKKELPKDFKFPEPKKKVVLPTIGTYDIEDENVNFDIESDYGEDDFEEEGELEDDDEKDGEIDIGEDLELTEEEINLLTEEEKKELGLI